jgi:RHS repeat-associated protein
MTVNALNQITGHTVPGKLELLGSSPAATVMVNSASTTRQSGQPDRYGIEVPVDNATTARQVALNVEATDGATTTSKTVKRSLAAANQTFSYDLDGNLISDGIWNYTWDAENRLIEAEYLLASTDADKRKLHYTYDHQSRRILRRELHWNTTRNTWYAERQTKYLYDGWNCIAEILNETTLWKKHTWGLDLSNTMQGAGGVGGLFATEDLLNNYSAAPAYDGNGNLTALVGKGTDTLLAEYEYTAFGETLTAKGPHAQDNSYRFSTKPLDTDTGLYYYGYRYYDPVTGRWPSRDPIGENGGLNLYAFVGNDPIGDVDVLGLIVLEFNAFIPGRLGKKVNGVLEIGGQAIGGTWAQEPEPFSPWWFGTDNRGFGGGSARLKSVTKNIAADEIGKLEGQGAALVKTIAGSSKRIRKVFVLGNVNANQPLLEFQEKTAAPTQDVTVKDINACKSTIKIKAAASYPFSNIAPDINYTVTWTVGRLDSGKIKVSAKGFHNRVPNYEGLVDGGQFYKFDTKGSGPGLWDLGILWKNFNEGPKEY